MGKKKSKNNKSSMEKYIIDVNKTVNNQSPAKMLKLLEPKKKWFWSKELNLVSLVVALILGAGLYHLVLNVISWKSCPFSVGVINDSTGIHFKLGFLWGIYLTWVVGNQLAKLFNRYVIGE